MKLKGDGEEGDGDVRERQVGDVEVGDGPHPGRHNHHVDDEGVPHARRHRDQAVEEGEQEHDGGGDVVQVHAVLVLLVLHGEGGLVVKHFFSNRSLVPCDLRPSLESS